jgi:hypothetical protein
MTDGEMNRLREMIDGDVIYLRWFEEGGAKVIKTDGFFHVYECKPYDMGESFNSCLRTPEEVIKKIELWT